MHLYHCQRIAESGVAQMPLTIEHGLQNFVTGLTVQARGKKSKLGSEALEQEAEIQISCKVSTTFASILRCNK